VIVSNLSIDVKSGEILAIAGVQGNGQSEIARAIMNLESLVTGSIKVEGSEILGKTVHESIKTGIAFIPESRELDGLIGSFSIAENLILNTHDVEPFAKLGQLSKSAIANNASERVKEFDEAFIKLARSVYYTNDVRAKIKKEINLKYSSGFVEEKSYQSY
jgi:simple sugar transport system ATP-binding protein